MASIIEGYNYDIFISYRQKDNKGEKWVSEFVEALKTELESTFKEEISVYFDINPSDYLLESYDVDASLKDKLKCLVFIPIISRTYCDSKSFAWVHEFRAFVEMASNDKFGLKVKLPNGNVASRVLPVRIHDLDAADIKECESVLGGVLRGIEFIYKEAGIDKPLAPDDDEKKNLNNTKYRIQIVKVAHAIKEIIQGMKNEPAQTVIEKEQSKESFKEVKPEKVKKEMDKPAKANRNRFLIPIAVVVLLVIAAIIVYPKIFKRDTLERLRASGERISVAIMPFQNLTNDTTKNYCEKGVQTLITNSLSNNNEILIRQADVINSLLQGRGITNYASLTPSVASSISRKLDADIVLTGNIIPAGPDVRLTAQLINSRTKEILKPFQTEGPNKEEDILRMTDSLSLKIRDYLIISILKKEVPVDHKQLSSTSSPEAYSNFINGNSFFNKGDYAAASNLLSRAIKADSTFTFAKIFLCFSLGNQGMLDSAKRLCAKIYKTRDHMTRQQELWTNFIHALLFKTPNDEINSLKQLEAFDNQVPLTYSNLGSNYNQLYQYDKAIPEYRKALELYKKWGTKPINAGCYNGLGYAYHKTGQYKKEKKLYKKAEKDFPDNPNLIYRQAVLALTEGNTIKVNAYIEKYISLRKESSASEAAIAVNLAGIYSEADLLDNAEEYYRQALSLGLENLGRMNTLAYFLIDKDRNINEGLKLTDTVLKSNPENYSYLHTKGWGLYKQGKYQEAKEILQKSWNIRMEKAIYNHEAFLHLEAAKKAVAGLK